MGGTFWLLGSSALSAFVYTVYWVMTPFGWLGGLHETRIDSDDMTRALIAIGASGAGGERKEKVGFAISRKTFRLTILFGLAVDRRGLDSIAARSESQDLHAVVRVLLQSVQNGLARGGDLGVLGVLVVPGVGGSVDNLYIRLQYLNNLRFDSSI